MAQVEFQGKDLEEAIAQAAEALSLPPEKVKFSVITMGGKGFLGFGKRKARITVDPDDPSLAVEEDEGRRSAAQAAPRPAAVNDGGKKSDRPGLETAPQRVKDKPRKSQTREADPEAVGGKIPARSKQQPEVSQNNGRSSSPAYPKPGRKMSETGAEARTEEAKELTWEHVPPPLSHPGPGEKEEPADELALEAAAVTGEIVSKMGFTAEVKAVRIGPRILLTLESGDNAIWIGGRGATLEALQLLTGKILSKKLKEAGAEGVRVVIDAADYRHRRQEALLENLKNLAEQARRSRKPQAMNGLGSADRRLVQLALRPFKDLSATHASGVKDSLIIAASGVQTRHRPRRRHHNSHQK